MSDEASQISQNRAGLTTENRPLTYRRLLEPGIFHGLSMTIYLIGGYWVTNTFNESILGFLGVLMMIWGGFKALIVLAIYGFAIYAALFRRDWFENTIERRLMQRLKTRMDKDIETGQLKRAMDRAHGMLIRYPYHQALRRRLASLLIAEARLAEAGRHLIYLPNLMDVEKQAVSAFCKAQGHDPIHILRKSLKGLRLIGLSPWDDRELLLANVGPNHPFREDIENYDPDKLYIYQLDEPDPLPKSALKTLLELHGAIDRESDKQSRLYKNLQVYFRYKNRSRLKALLQTNRGTILEILIAFILLVLCILFAFYRS